MWLLTKPSAHVLPREKGSSFDYSPPKKVGYAVEFEVMSQDSDRSDLFGRAISLDGGLLLAGAPKKHRDVPEVQLIVSSGTASEVGIATHIPVSWGANRYTYPGLMIKSRIPYNNADDNAHARD